MEPNWREEKGFTLIEMILVIVLLAIIGAALAAAFLPGMQTYLAVDFRKEAIQNARTAMQRVLKDTREAQTFAACGGLCVPTNTMTFTNVLNSAVTFDWAGTAQDPLTRNGNVLASNVDDFTVTFYDQAGLEPADETLIWRVRVDLRVTVGDQIVDLRSEVFPRNLGG